MVTRYKRAVEITAPRYMKTALLEHRVIGGLSEFQLRLTWKPRSESTA